MYVRESLVAPRDCGRPVGELSSDGGVLVIVTAVVHAALDVGDVVPTDATVPRSSLANCSLALGFDADALLPMPFPVGSSAAKTSSVWISACDDTVRIRWFSVRRCSRDRSLRTARSVERSSGGSSLRRSASSFSRCTSASLRNTICPFAANVHEDAIMVRVRVLN